MTGAASFRDFHGFPNDGPLPFRLAPRSWYPFWERHASAWWMNVWRYTVLLSEYWGSGTQNHHWTSIKILSASFRDRTNFRLTSVATRQKSEWLRWPMSWWLVNHHRVLSLDFLKQLKDMWISVEKAAACWNITTIFHDIPWYSQISLKHGLISTCQTS